MNFQGQRHSKLVQRKITSSTQADRAFAQVSVNNEGFTEIPIVLIPKSPFLCSCAVNVPSGPFVLWQKWHKSMGQLPPGVIWFWPGWCRISHIVTRATVTYNAPTRNCPTADNVMVNVDLSLTFRIGPDPEAVANFIYKLGAHRFDELIAAETKEAIRGLVYSVTHDKVNDLREEFAVGMLSTLNSKVVMYGVQITNVKITDVALPPDLQDRLERTTAFKTKMSEQEKIHENCVRALEDEAARSVETIRKSNARKLQEIEAERTKYDIERRAMEESARGRARVEEIEAMTAADVALKKSLGNEAVQKVTARQDAEALLKRTHIQCQTMRIESEKRVNVEVKRSEAELAVAESKAAVMIAQAEAEADGAEALKEKRRYELEWEKLGVLETIAAGRGRKFITGKKGEAILSALVPRPGVKGGDALRPRASSLTTSSSSHRGRDFSCRASTSDRYIVGGRVLVIR